MKWILPQQPEGVDVLDFILESRKIKDTKKFLNPSLDQLYDPFAMFGMQNAVDAVLWAIKKQKKIFIHGDFDVDGITATSILWDFLYRKLGANVEPYIPSRFDEGYGLSKESLDAILEKGGQVVITVDCGVKDVELVAEYSNRLDFIITDHHTLLESDSDFSKEMVIKEGNSFISKQALAVVHPRINNEYPFGEICGAAVAWKLCHALYSFATHYKKKIYAELEKFDVFSYLDLVALGTVCDIMPLVDENRVFVALGLERLRKTENKGIRALCSTASVDLDKLDSFHIGFALGPRLNAAGRLEHALDGVRLLVTQSENFARAQARKLDGLNQKRKALTQNLFEKAIEIAKKNAGDKIIIVKGEKWPEGIIGLIAARLTQMFSKPALVITKSDAFLKGSARSIVGFNIAKALRENSKYLVRHGGHAGAAGFSLTEEMFAPLYSSLVNYSNKNISEEDLVPNLVIDATLSEDDLELDFVSKLDALAPFGNANEKPIFVFKRGKVLSIGFMGHQNQHAKLVIQFPEGKHLTSLAFNYKDKDLDLLALENGQIVDLAGTLETNEWNGNVKVNLFLRSIRKS